MPQRVNSKSDIGNTKIASDVYDVNNCFLTDQGWVYRHFKGDPTDATNTRYWDEIIVAGESPGEQEITYSVESSKGSLLVTAPAFEGAPDEIKDIEYSGHIYSVESVDSITGDTIVTPTLKPATPVPDNNNAHGTPLNPGPSPDGYPQFPEIRSVSAPPDGGDGGDGGDGSDA